MRNDIIVFRKEKLNILKVAWKPCKYASHRVDRSVEDGKIQLLLLRTNAIGLVSNWSFYYILDRVRCKHKTLSDPVFPGATYM